MNRRFFAIAAFSVATLMCVVASAQPGGQRGQRGGRAGFGRSMTALLMNDAVRDDVGITDEQVTKLREIAQELRGAGMNREQLENLSQEERREKMREFMAEREKLEAKMMTKVKEVLDEKQMARLEQINLQASGMGMFRNPKVSEALKLNEEQRTELQESMRSLGQEMRDAISGDTPDAKKLAELREKMMDKAMDVLTDDQKAALKKLIGKPFDVSKLPMQGLGRRGGGRRSG